MSNKKVMMVCVIFYNNLEEIMNFIRELEKQKDTEIILGITVNKDKKKLATKIQSKIITIHIFYPKSNIGYLNGLFFSYDELIKKGYRSNWVVFCNTDVEIPNYKFFLQVNNRSYDDDVLCLAPSIFEKNKKIYENPQYLYRYSLKSLNRRIFIFSHPSISRFYIYLSVQKAKLTKRSKQVSSVVYSAHGSFFILKYSFLNRIVRKYMSLMYSEEAFVAEEVKSLNGKIYYDSTLEVIHNESQTTSKLNFKIKSKYIADSLKQIKNKYFLG